MKPRMWSHSPSMNGFVLMNSILNLKTTQQIVIPSKFCWLGKTYSPGRTLKNRPSPNQEKKRMTLPGLEPGTSTEFRFHVVNVVL